MFYFYLYLGRWSNFTNIFQMGLKPPSRLTWNQKNTPWKRKSVFQTSTIVFDVNFQGVRGQFTIIFGVPAVSSLGDVPSPSRFDESKSWFLDGNSQQRFYTCNDGSPHFCWHKMPPHLRWLTTETTLLPIRCFWKSLNVKSWIFVYNKKLVECIFGTWKATQTPRCFSFLRICLAWFG